MTNITSRWADFLNSFADLGTVYVVSCVIESKGFEEEGVAVTLEHQWDETRLRTAIHEIASAMPAAKTSSALVVTQQRNRRRHVGVRVAMLATALAVAVVALIVLRRPSAPHAIASTSSASAPTDELAAALATDERGIAVVIHGVWTTTNTVCPAGQATCTNGVPVEGPIDGINNGSKVELRGWYDGSRILLVSRPTPWDGPPPVAEFPTNPCPGRSNHDLPQSFDRGELVNHLATMSDRVAGSWVDQATRLQVIWLVGEVTPDERAGIEAAAGSLQVCVIGGARFTTTELDKVSLQLLKLQQAGKLQISGGHDSGMAGNVVVVPLETISPTGRNDVAAMGDRVIVVPFIELVDRELSALARFQPKNPDNIEIMTFASHQGSDLAGLGTFTLRYDEIERCLYLTMEQSPARIAPVWPFGYGARPNPAAIFDSVGQQIATAGQVISLAGGYEQLEPVYFNGSNTCGADSMWVVTASS